MSERLRYLTDEEMLHDGAGEGFGVALHRGSKEIQSHEQEVVQLMEVLFRQSIREGVQRIKNSLPDTSLQMYTSDEEQAAEQMCYEGGIILFDATLNKNHSESPK